MTDTFSYSTTFTIDKAHLTECFEQSVEVDTSIMQYKRAIISLVFGITLLVFELVSDYIAFFVVSLGILEVFSTRYRKTWWLWRQMLGKSYKSEVNMTIDDAGIHNKSSHVEQHIPWDKVTKVDQTQEGLIIRHDKGASYLSNRCLSDQAIAFITAKSDAVTE